MFESSAIVRQSTQVVAEHLLVQIPEQVERFYAHVGSFQSALEQTPEILKPISVDLSVNVLFRMVNNFVPEIFLEPHVGHERIGVDRATGFDVSANFGLQVMLATGGNHNCADFSATLQNAHDRSFVFGASLSYPAKVLVSVHVASGSADESFVHFDRAPSSAEFQNRAVLHCEPDAVKHEPCGLLSDAESACDFIGTDAVLAVGNHPNSDKPLVERERGVLKDGSNFCAELLFGMLALAFPHAPSRDEADFFASASGALDTLRPAALNHEVETVVSVSEMKDGLLKSFGLLHGVPHSRKYDRYASLSQVYYCPSKSVSKQTTLTPFRMNTYAKPGGRGAPTLAREFEAGLEKSRELGTCAILRQALLVEVLQLPSSSSFRMTAFRNVANAARGHG